jgi:hypothetical protein
VSLQRAAADDAVLHHQPVKEENAFRKAEAVDQ